MDMDMVLRDVIREGEHNRALDSLAECISAGQILLGTLRTVEGHADIPRHVPGATARLHGMEREARDLLAQLVALEHQYTTLEGGD